MRPVNTGNNPANFPNYPTGPPWTAFTGSAVQSDTFTFRAAAPKALLGAKPFRIQVLDSLFTLATTPKSKLTPKLTAAKPYLNNAVEVVYQSAAPGLATAIGKSCSYCEQFLPGQIAVEHVVPKAPYPYFSMCWKNFLFACEACNGYKSSKPLRKEAGKWKPKPANDSDYYQLIRNNYLFADTGQKTLTNLLPTLGWMDTRFKPARWTAIDAGDAVNAANTFISSDVVTRVVMAKVPTTKGGNPTNSVSVQVHLVPTGAQAQQTVSLAALDKDGTAQGKISDTRMFNATVNWFRILTVLSGLGNALATVPSSQQAALFNTLWPGVLAAAQPLGFWSIWAVIVGTLLDTTVPGTTTKFIDKFFTDTNNQWGFPGTDPTRAV